MREAVLVSLLSCGLLLVANSPAISGSSITDLSKPQTGQSRDVLDHNLKPVQLGATDADHDEGPRNSDASRTVICQMVKRFASELPRGTTELACPAIPAGVQVHLARGTNSVRR